MLSPIVMTAASILLENLGASAPELLQKALDHVSEGNTGNVISNADFVFALRLAERDMENNPDPQADPGE